MWWLILFLIPQCNSLTWFLDIKTIPNSLCPSNVLKDIYTAFDYWSKRFGITFERLDEKSSDIHISFKQENHSHHKEFDGKGGALAHAYRKEGIICLDLSEFWTDINEINDSSTDFFTVILHEIGHIIGLNHDFFDEKSIMFPSYSKRDKKYIKSIKKCICDSDKRVISFRNIIIFLDKDCFYSEHLKFKGHAISNFNRNQSNIVGVCDNFRWKNEVIFTRRSIYGNGTKFSYKILHLKQPAISSVVCLEDDIFVFSQTRLWLVKKNNLINVFTLPFTVKDSFVKNKTLYIRDVNKNYYTFRNTPEEINMKLTC